MCVYYILFPQLQSVYDMSTRAINEGESSLGVLGFITMLAYFTEYMTIPDAMNFGFEVKY